MATICCLIVTFYDANYAIFNKHHELQKENKQIKNRKEKVRLINIYSSIVTYFEYLSISCLFLINTNTSKDPLKLIAISMNIDKKIQGPFTAPHLILEIGD